MKPVEELTVDPNRYYLTRAQRRAVWQNEISMFIVLAMPVLVAAFWYGSTIQMFVNGQLTVPASFSRGVGLTLLITIVVIAGGALRLFLQPAAERVANAQPVRGYRRLSFAAFDALLVFLITLQSLAGVAPQDQVGAATLAIVLGVLAGGVAFICMHAMVDIPSGREPTALELWRAEIQS